MKKWYHDASGNVSSKRVFGAMVTLTGLILGYVGAFGRNTDLIEYAKWCVGTGSGLLGIGVIEHLRGGSR